MTDQERKNWDYLVAAVQNEQAAYVNARATRYARAIIAVNKQLDILERLKKVDSILDECMVPTTHEN